MLIVLCLVLLTGCQNKIKYTAPSGMAHDMSAYGVESAHFYQISYDEVLQLIEKKQTIIVYFGYESCPWCEELVPVLDSVCDDFEVNIYYVDVKSAENLANKEGLNKLTEYARQTNEEGELIFFFPSVLFIQKGILVNQHIGTVSGHDTYKAKMTEKQITRCKYLLAKKFKEVLGYE